MLEDHIIFISFQSVLKVLRGIFSNNYGGVYHDLDQIYRGEHQRKSSYDTLTI